MLQVHTFPLKLCDESWHDSDALLDIHEYFLTKSDLSFHSVIDEVLTFKTLVVKQSGSRGVPDDSC